MRPIRLSTLFLIGKSPSFFLPVLMMPHALYFRSSGKSRENAPIVEDDVESQGYLGSVEAENKEQVEPTSNGQEETPEESTALEQLLQERNAIIEEQQAKAMGRGKRERRSKFYNLSTTEEANEAGKPEGQNIVLEEEDFLDEDAVDPGGPKQTQGPDTDYQPARVPIAPRVTEDEQGEEGQSENLKSSAKATFGHLPWVKELSQSQVDDLKALVKSHGDAAARNQSRGNSSKSGVRARSTFHACSHARGKNTVKI